MPEVKRGRDREMRYPSHGGPTVRISVPPAVSLCWSGHRECRMPGFEPIRDHRSPAEISVVVRDSRRASIITGTPVDVDGLAGVNPAGRIDRTPARGAV
jgi:hypothetical protein